ncbi:hypothetical protein FOZ63_032195 [Perkinsus olseni]|uniref:Uncharacterized protein n=1 Tax=Perkinsus olseni TaxID=32597 RepID=A0A7J6PZP0_PEROL|nr:hypothetical protein FOZ62_003985 [Perkinsus olseni]KAF4723417.1 hypothetical protein FOZ63_032195 [Perkinsus olseni]
MPVEEGFVNVNIDGQEVKLILDSALMSLDAGEALDESKAGEYKFVDYAYDPESYRAFAAVWVSSLRPFDAQGALLMKEGLVRKRPISFLSMVDTGANGIYLPYPGLLEDIKSKFKMKLEKIGYSEKQINEMWREDQGPLVQVKEEAFDSLPVLGLQLGEGDNSIPIRIHPRHYCVHTGKGYVIIFVQENDMNLIGTPFFRAYSVHVDYTNNKIALLEN